VPGHINLQAVNGNPDYYRTCASFFICGTPMETDAGPDALKAPDPAKAKALLEEAGYDCSKPIVVLDPTDNPTLPGGARSAGLGDPERRRACPCGTRHCGRADARPPRPSSWQAGD
jgi:ABC-type transport system substrate-binding protein